jgi:hypothetical protein
MRLTAKRYAEVLARIHRKLVRRFPIGCTVRASRKAVRRHVVKRKHAQRRGMVVGYYAGVSPKVLWDGRRTTSDYAWEFLTRMRPRRRQP